MSWNVAEAVSVATDFLCLTLEFPVKEIFVRSGMKALCLSIDPKKIISIGHPNIVRLSSIKKFFSHVISRKIFVRSVQRDLASR